MTQQTTPPIDSPWPIGHNKSQIREFKVADEDIPPILIWKTESDSHLMENTVAKFRSATRNLWFSWNLLEIKKESFIVETQFQAIYV